MKTMRFTIAVLLAVAVVQSVSAQDWVYKHTEIRKVDGRITQAAHRAALQETTDWVNDVGPEPNGIQCIMSEGPTSRDYYVWAHEDNSDNRYDLTSLVWTGEASFDQIRDILLQDGVLCGFDAGRTQSVHYFRRLH